MISNGHILLSVPLVYRQCVPDSAGRYDSQEFLFLLWGFTVSAQCGELICEVRELPCELICPHEKIRCVLCSGVLSKCDTHEFAFARSAPQQVTGSLKPGPSQAVRALAPTHSRQQGQVCSFVCLLQF